MVKFLRDPKGKDPPGMCHAWLMGIPSAVARNQRPMTSIQVCVLRPLAGSVAVRV